MISDTRLPRDHKIDMVKTAAIWSVVLCHVAAAPFSGGVVGTTSWYSAVLWTSLAHACVPLFFMASGALLLKPEKELTFQKLYTQNLPRILAALFFWAFTLLNGIPVQWRMNMTYASTGYMLLGHYLSVYHPRPNRSSSVLILLAGFLLTFWGTCLMSYMTGRPNDHFLEGMGVFIFLVVWGIWSLCQTVPLSQTGRKLIGFMSKASFCIYLTHIFFLQAFARWGLRAIDGPVLLTVPLISGLIICCCCAVYMVLSRVPVVRRWLI